MKFLALLVVVASCAAHADNTTDRVLLGKLIFNDASLSEPAGQSCNRCHSADAAHADPGNMISPGATPELFGKRNAPSISYVKFNPALYRDEVEDHWVGGFFLDGRERTLEDQVTRPFFDALEMANPSPAALVAKVRAAPYSPAIRAAYGEDFFRDEDRAMAAIADALAAYQRGPEFASFSSRYDYYLQNKLTLTTEEILGLEVFEAEDKGNCAACHPSQVGPDGEPPLFTDYTYDNLGLPANTELPFLGMAPTHNPAGSQFKDEGLAANPHIHDPAEQRGKFKVPSLRNVALTAPYMHSGQFETLREAVEFYNDRDVNDKWGPAEIADNVNSEELGDLKLSEAEIDALLVFLETLSDGYVIPAP